MAIESDRAEILSGVRAGETIGGPIAMLDRESRLGQLAADDARPAEPPPDAGGARRAPVTRPRPGHADLAGVAKYGRTDVRDILERASARETAARVAAGRGCPSAAERAGIRIASHVSRIGEVAFPTARVVSSRDAAALPDDAPLRCVDADVERQMIAEIDRAREAGDTLGGAFEVIATGVPIGLGSYVQWDRKLDGRLAQAMMSIPAIKAVGIGTGPRPLRRRARASTMRSSRSPGWTARRPASRARRNNAGGLEGGVTNGEDLRVSACMKPISTLMKPLRSVDLATMSEVAAAIERSDVCAVPAAAVVGEAMVALVLADALVEKFGGDSVAELERAISAWTSTVREQFSATRLVDPRSFACLYDSADSAIRGVASSSARVRRLSRGRRGPDADR